MISKFVNQIVKARREPDAIAWTPGGRLVTANEGDYDLDLREGDFSGRRDFTVFTLVVERANQQRDNAQVKRLYSSHHPSQ